MNIYLSHRHPHADGVTPDTELFQQALDELAQAGGGRLVVDCGRYALGGLRIGSNTCLWLSPGAELIVSENYDDFAQATALSRAESSDRAFLYAVDAQNITICGGGEIYGSADGWFSVALTPWVTARQPRRVRGSFCWKIAVASGWKTSPYDMPRCGQFIWSPVRGWWLTASPSTMI